MPELPEVETLCRQLSDVVSGAKILDMKILDPKLGNMEHLRGRTILAPRRAGKCLYFLLDDQGTLILHLRMTGRLLWQKETLPLSPHTRFIMQFPCGRLDLIDPRRFATLAVRREQPASKAAIDPLEKIPPRLLRQVGEKKTMPIKTFLMDQRYISGIGNIYACEILHASLIHPGRKTKEVSFEEWRKISSFAVKILNKAITCRGTTVSDWRDLFGRKGEYQNHLKVYARAGKPCYRCGGAIQRMKVGGRGTYYCPDCQV